VSVLLFFLVDCVMRGKRGLVVMGVQDGVTG
jgi:hypothetical protein